MSTQSNDNTSNPLLKSTDESYALIETNLNDKLQDTNDENDNDSTSPLAFIALILVTTLFLSAIIFQSNNSSSTTIDNNSKLIASTQNKISKRRNWPTVISTWNFIDAVEIAYDTLIKTNDSLESIVSGCSYCEYNPWDCGWSVGYGAKPDSIGEVTLDSLIMYGPTHSAGGVGQLRNIKNAIGVAKAVMLHTTHTLLVGESATKFALMMGFKQETLSTARSKKIHKIWKKNKCQPNSFMDLLDANNSCPPYAHSHNNRYRYIHHDNDNDNEYNGWNDFGHDTIGMIAIDRNGAMTVGTSTNGLRYKVHGRVGDSAIVGHGAYVKQGVGGSVATGNGDVMMLYAPTRIAVHNMQNGMNVKKACDNALQQIVDGYKTFEGALICMDAKGNYAASKYMNRPFHYVYKDKYLGSAKMFKIS